MAMTKTEQRLHDVGKVSGVGVGDTFWFGDGDELLELLYEEGWRGHRYVAPYYWVVKFLPPVRIERGEITDSLVIEDVRYISYTEGDVNFSDNTMCGEQGAAS